MNEFNDVMIDLETLGTSPGCAIVSIGAVPFNEFGVSEQGFYRAIPTPLWTVAGITTDGLRKEQGTIDWWKGQSEEAREVFNTVNRHTHRSALSELALFLNGLSGPRVWGNGADFDLPIITAAARIVELDPMSFWKPYNGRCYRTVKNQFKDVKLARTGTYHNALDDARCQAEHLVEICQTRGWKLA
jgi:exodeoxyribonuclease VIII